MVEQFFYYFLFFFSYSVIGWITETLSCSIEHRKWVLNRGFLIGPYCPIYGSCAIFMLLFLKGYLNDPIVLFILIMVSASIFEYFTSLLMEKLFHARWWDYSNFPFNIEGRICLLNAFLFGVLGLAFMYVIHPFYSGILSSFPETVLLGLGIFTFLIFVVDLFFSCSIMTKLKLNLNHFRQDSTESIDREVRKFIRENHYLTKRLFSAFPKVHFSLPKGNHILASFKDRIKAYDQVKQERKEQIRLEKEKIRKLKEQHAEESKILNEKKHLKKMKKEKPNL